MNKNKVKTLILNHIKKVGWLSYPQLLRYLSAEGAEVNGGFELQIADKNIVLWGGLSEVVVQSLTELFSENKVVGMPAPIELYSIEGMSFAQPLVLNIPAERLETPSVFLTYLSYVAEVSAPKDVQ